MISISLVFDRKIYSSEAIQKAAYRGQYAFTLDIKTEGESFLCVLLSNITTAPETFNIAVENFKKDALDYQLRGKLRAETEGIRNLILGVAFSNSGLI